ncbi:restriction endonuclease subunit S [Vibrio cholerae]|nr:restriction endonuclease subunit S [Vibrio cholerae]EJL6644660.1 restriction endonuclease subunit S [Vibrio cholerae]
MSCKLPLETCITSANTGLDAIKRAPIVEQDTGIRCLRIQDVSQVKSFEDWGFTDVTPANFKKFQLKKDDILIARTGGSIGVNRYIEEDLQSVYNNGLIRIRVDIERYDPKFVFYLLRTESFKQHINAIAFSTAAQPNMKIRDFLRFEFLDITLEQQKLIARNLTSLDRKIDLNKKTNQTLEQMAQAIFKSWFVDFDPVKAKMNGEQPEGMAEATASLFPDKGARLQTKLSSSNVASSMVDIAEARGWTELQVKGTEDFRREAWLEASSRGLGVRGYKPKEEDLARLKKLASERQPNEIEAREQADQPRVSPGEKEGVKSTANKPDTAAPKQAESSNEGNKNVQDKEDINRLAGKLVEHGKAPYEHNPDNRQSYYVTLENTDGQKTTTWGIDLERAVKDGDFQPGDQVELENKGRKPVTVSKDIKDDKGNVVDTQEINTHRNEWEVKAQAIRDKTRDARDVVKEHPDLVNEVAAVKVAEKFSQKFDNEEDRNRFLEKVRSQVASNVSSGQKSPEIKLREERQLERSNQDEER